MNVVRVESDPEMSAHELIALADEALAGLDHRRIDFEDAALGESLRAGFEQEGWLTERLVWMLHEAPPPPGPEVAVEEVPYDDVHELRVAWHFENFPDLDPSSTGSVALPRSPRSTSIPSIAEPGSVRRSRARRSRPRATPTSC